MNGTRPNFIMCCANCEFWRPGVNPEGKCAGRAPTGDGWPTTTAHDSCGDFALSVAGEEQIRTIGEILDVPSYHSEPLRVAILHINDLIRFRNEHLFADRPHGGPDEQ